MSSLCKTVGRRLEAAAGVTLIAIVRGYQLTISPLLGPRCRFRPTCSEYCIEAVRRYGALRGGLKAVRRVARCHPWNPGGYDPP